MKKVFILGMKKSGVAMALLLASYPLEILITDKEDPQDDVKENLLRQGIRVEITEEQAELLDDSYDVVIKNPGIIRSHPVVTKALKLKIPVINEIEACFSLLPKDICIIGITGSNGKTTTTTLIYELLKQVKGRVHLAGNIGIPLASIVKDIHPGDIIVMEISDHQLIDMTNFKTHISVLTNLSPVHLDWHGTYENYQQVKMRIFAHHTAEDMAIINGEDVVVKNLTRDIRSKKLIFGSPNGDVYIANNAIYYHQELIINLDDILLKGEHNYLNIMAAILVYKQFAISNVVISAYLKQFRGLEHRLEYVDTIKGRIFYNDAKSTNNQATISALKAFKQPIILLIGGLNRHIPFTSLVPFLTYVRLIICYGETRYELSTLAQENHIPYFVFKNLKDATLKAYEQSQEGDVILLSPACASWDQYPDFETRGREFKNIISILAHENKNS